MLGLTSQRRMTLAEDQELLAVVERRFVELAESIDESRKETRERFDRLETEVRHAHVRIESLEGVVQQVAEGVANVDENLERFQAEVQGEFKEVRALIGQSYADLDQRVTALEGR